MLEKYDNNTIVRNYSSGFDVKEYIQEELIPKAFPNINIAKLNLGLTGIASEMISQAIEDSYATASLMITSVRRHPVRRSSADIISLWTVLSGMKLPGTRSTNRSWSWNRQRLL